ncbi:MAG: elongation factor P [Patescibacteria group bacterium]
MIKAGSVNKGSYLNWQGQPAVVVDKEFYNPGKGSAVVRFKIKNIKNGNVVKEVIKTDELIEEIVVDQRQAQFAYHSGDQLVFINPHTYEQYEVASSLLGDDSAYVKEGDNFQLAVLEDEVIGVQLPKKVVLKVVETESAVKGNTVTGATKPAKMETGLTVKVPLFINKGDEIIVNTETGQYVSRSN